MELAALLLSSVERTKRKKPKKLKEVGFILAQQRAQLMLSDAFCL